MVDSMVQMFVAALQFFDENKHNLLWDFVRVCPTLTFGPMMNEVSSPASLCASNGLFWYYLFSGIPQSYPDDYKGGWVDVRDASTALVKAIETPEAGNDRFIIKGSDFTWKEWRASESSL